MMTTSTTDTAGRGPALLGQTVVVIGGSSGIGLETARRARAEGAELVLAGLDRGPLEDVATELGAKQIAAFDATDPEALKGFFADGGEQLVLA
jgi:NAD(P)-dependent dehydrogenase (short-subunit alcohol dehydrogenase family)